MSKKFNVNDIVNETKNELDYSPLFQSKSESLSKQDSPAPQTNDNVKEYASMPESQHASKTAKQKASMPESQTSGNLEIQHNMTATEKVTYRFHPEGKYAIEDIKTILARKVGIKASFEAIAEEAILIAYEDLLENQHASKLARRLARMPENKKTS